MSADASDFDGLGFSGADISGVMRAMPAELSAITREAIVLSALESAAKAQELGLAPGTDTVARTAAPPAVPTAAAGGASSPENLGNQLTNTLLAQMQNALKNWQTQHGMS